MGGDTCRSYPACPVALLRLPRAGAARPALPPRPGWTWAQSSPPLCCLVLFVSARVADAASPGRARTRASCLAAADALATAPSLKSCAQETRPAYRLAVNVRLLRAFHFEEAALRHSPSPESCAQETKPAYRSAANIRLLRAFHFEEGALRDWSVASSVPHAPPSPSEAHAPVHWPRRVVSSAADVSMIHPFLAVLLDPLRFFCRFCDVSHQQSARIALRCRTLVQSMSATQMCYRAVSFVKAKPISFILKTRQTSGDCSHVNEKRPSLCAGAVRANKYH